MRPRRCATALFTRGRWHGGTPGMRGVSDRSRRPCEEGGEVGRDGRVAYAVPRAGRDRALAAERPRQRVAHRFERRRPAAREDQRRERGIAECGARHDDRRRVAQGDWAPSPGFASAAERERRAVEEERQRADARAARTVEDECRRREHAATLAAVGATAEDQATWHILATSPTPLPTIFRTALFRAPGERTPPRIVLRSADERARAVGDGSARTRREVERRLRVRFPAYARASLAGGMSAHYVAFDDCAEQPADATRGDVVAAVRSATP
jgi:hypothetical protein